jgi:hypothetical protein
MTLLVILSDTEPVEVESKGSSVGASSASRHPALSFAAFWGLS